MSRRMVVANAYSSDKFMSRQLYCLKFSYERVSHRHGKSDCVCVCVFLSLVDREIVFFCTSDSIVLHSLGIFFFFF